VSERGQWSRHSPEPGGSLVIDAGNLLRNSFYRKSLDAHDDFFTGSDRNGIYSFM